MWLLRRHSHTLPATKKYGVVPEWMIGCWQRHALVSTVEEETDCTTRVIYLQAGTRYVDLRIAPRSSLPGKGKDRFVQLGKQLADTGHCLVTPQGEMGLMETWTASHSNTVRSEQQHHHHIIPTQASEFAWHDGDASSSKSNLTALTSTHETFVPPESHSCLLCRREFPDENTLQGHLVSGGHLARLAEFPSSEVWVASDESRRRPDATQTAMHPVARWVSDFNFQPCAAYPEPGLMAFQPPPFGPGRILEVAPSRSYIEDWRPLGGTDGLAISFTLEDEVETATGASTGASGVLVAVGDHAALVIDRARPLAYSNDAEGENLAKLIAGDRLAGMSPQEALHCEYSYAVRRGRGEGDYEILLSTLPDRHGESLMTPLDEEGDSCGMWSIDLASGVAEQRGAVTSCGLEVTRRWSVEHWLFRDDAGNVVAGE